jgi:hypothetical protein
MSHTIPAAVRRQLRQEARFGCCACGLPVFDYHHIIPRGVEQHDRPEDMMVLCPNHHDGVTKGAVTEDAQRMWKATPFNETKGYADGLLAVGQDFCAVECGTCLLVNDGVLISVDDEPLLQFAVEDRRVLLSLDLFDEADSLLALIEQNEWVSGDPAIWDLEASYQRLTIRQAPGDVRMRLDVRALPMTLRVRLWRHGHLIDLAPDRILVGSRDAVLAGGFGMEARYLGFVGMRLALSTHDGALSMVPDERYGQGLLVSEGDRVRRLAKCVNGLSRLRRSLPKP